jgi:diadenosine tetraphosphate (Ap4A) HIT family hydrolase
MYDKNNIFAKIISGDIAAEKLYEDDKILAIKDINPAADIHILVVPKEPYIDFADFISRASQEDISHYFKTVEKIAKESGSEDYRLITNKGEAAGQSVFHFHTHILSGLSNNELIDKNL